MTREAKATAKKAWYEVQKLKPGFLEGRRAGARRWREANPGMSRGVKK